MRRRSFRGRRGRRGFKRSSGFRKQKRANRKYNSYRMARGGIRL